MGSAVGRGTQRRATLLRGVPIQRQREWERRRMEPIDFGGALLRRWWVVVTFGVVGALVAIFLVSSGQTKPLHAEAAPVSSWPWTAAAVVGAAPLGGGGSATLGGGGPTTNQIVFYSQEQSVLEAAAKSAGLNKPFSQLQKAVSASGPSKFTSPGTVLLNVDGPTPDKASAFANVYASQLGKYINGLVVAHQSAQSLHLQQEITALQSKINFGAPRTLQRSCPKWTPTSPSNRRLRPSRPPRVMRWSGPRHRVRLCGCQRLR